MPITDNDFSKVAHDLIKLIRNPKKPLTKDSFESILYNLLTQKHFDADLFSQEFLQYAPRFEQAKDSISLEPQGKTVSNPGWFGFEPKYTDENFIKKDHEGLFAVTYKRYYSLLLPEASAQDVVFFLIHFYKSLPELFRRLYKLAYDSHSKISFKVPNTMAGFLSHQDTLVVHFVNKQLSSQIHEIVLSHFARYGFHYKKRFHRVDKGFDFKNEAIKKGSHSKLIANILSEHLFKHKDLLASADEAKIVQWLKDCLKIINTWSPKEFAKKLHAL